MTGETLEGEFISYDEHTEEIKIRRTFDQRIFAIPEGQLTHSNRLKAVELQNKNVQPYWYSSYEEAQEQSTKNRILLLCLNGGEPESFELFCNKLLRNRNFQSLLESRGFKVCIIKTIPESLVSIPPHPNDSSAKHERIDEIYPNIPLLLIESRSTRFPKDNPLKRCIPITAPDNLPAPGPFSPKYDGKFLSNETIHKTVEELSPR